MLDKQVQRVVVVVDDGSLVGGSCTRTREVDEGVDRKERERVIPHVSEYEMTTSASAANSNLFSQKEGETRLNPGIRGSRRPSDDRAGGEQVVTGVCM